MTTIVGLDLSLTSTGIALDERTEAISCSLKGVERLRYIAREVMLRVMPTKDPVVCIEGYSFGSRNSQAHAIGELGGVVRFHLYELDIPFVEIPPTCRAKFATGKGNAGKNEVVSAISARTGIAWSGKGADDMCDAWILEEIGRVYFGVPRFEWPKSHLAALEKIDWSPFQLNQARDSEYETP